jgi:hypothetical protein
MKKTTLKSILTQCKKTINTIFDDAEETRLTKEQMEEVLELIAKQTSDQDLIETEAIKLAEPKSSIFKTGSAAEERGAYVHTKSASEKFDNMNGR